MAWYSLLGIGLAAWLVASVALGLAVGSLATRLKRVRPAPAGRRRLRLVA